MLPYTEDVLHPDKALGLPNWPIELADLEPYYLQVQEAMGVPNSPFSEELVHQFDNEVPFRSSSVRLRFSKCAPFAKRNFSKTLGKQCLAARKVTVFTHANVLSVDVNAAGDVALGVTATNYGGIKYKFLANHVAICTGTIEAARLLLASTAACPQGVGNCRGQVGCYFHDHVEIRAAVVPPEDRARVVRAFAPYVKAGTTYRAKLEATAALRTQKSLLSVAGQFSIEEPAGSGPDLIRRLLRGRQQGRRSQDLRREVLGLAAASVEMVKLAVEAHYRNRRRVSRLANVVLDLDVEQRPDCESRIRLSDERDALGMRKVILDWRISRDEHETLSFYAQELRALFCKHGLATVPWPAQVPHEDEPWYGSNQRDTFHMMGGTRMGADPATSVVDSSLKVHDLRNLYVVSCGVFPTGGSSNPTFTMMALAFRLADQLLAKSASGAVWNCGADRAQAPQL